MKITKEGILNSSISIGAVMMILPVFLWFNSSKADQKTVEKIEKKVEEKSEKDQAYQLKQLELDVKQTAILENLSIMVDKLETKIERIQ